MKLNEIFDAQHDKAKIIALRDEFHMIKDVGNREIRFEGNYR